MLLDFGLPAVISALLVLPFIILELGNRPSVIENFPFPLFIFLWLLPLAFILVLRPILRGRPSEDSSEHRVSLALRIAFLVLVAWMWVAIVRDQMPCFLGVPNCD